MKKLVCLLGIAISFLFVSKSQAIMLGIYQHGALVPSVTYTATTDTVVGITCQLACSEDGSLVDEANIHYGGDPDNAQPVPTAKIHWTFYDVDSHHKLDGYIKCTDDDFVPFSWKDHAGLNSEGTQGYLVFKIKDEAYNPRYAWGMNANAFYVDSASNDVAFIPVVPLAREDFDDNGVIQKLTYGIRGGHRFDLRYWVPDEYNAQTTMVIWLTDPILDSHNKPKDLYIFAWNDEEMGVSLPLTLPHELNYIDPCKIDNWQGYTEGFISFEMPGTVDGVAYSVVWSDKIGATQTLLAAECSANNTTVVYSVPDQDGNCCHTHGHGFQTQ